LYEVRRLAELTARLEVSPDSFGLLEVGTSNLADVLAWLSQAGCRYPRGRSAALLDASLVHRTSDNNAGFMAGPREGWCGIHDVSDALLEAGAVAVADSPRRLQPILSMVQRHYAEVAARTVDTAGNLSITDWAHSLVPWQQP
jgi:hypothetical protein